MANCMATSCLLHGQGLDETLVLHGKSQASLTTIAEAHEWLVRALLFAEHSEVYEEASLNASNCNISGDNVQKSSTMLLQNRKKRLRPSLIIPGRTTMGKQTCKRSVHPKAVNAFLRSRIGASTDDSRTENLSSTTEMDLKP
eukprot:Clim_evm51s11 gene=Clim_evmTU51s11